MNGNLDQLVGVKEDNQRWLPACYEPGDNKAHCWAASGPPYGMRGGHEYYFGSSSIMDYTRQ